MLWPLFLCKDTNFLNLPPLSTCWWPPAPKEHVWMMLSRDKECPQLDMWSTDWLSIFQIILVQHFLNVPNVWCFLFGFWYFSLPFLWMECFCSILNITYLSFTKDIEPIDSLRQVVEKICKSGFQVSCADHDLTLGPWASPGDLASMPRLSACTHQSDVA